MGVMGRQGLAYAVFFLNFHTEIAQRRGKVYLFQPH